jgi:hypothetical protein
MGMSDKFREKAQEMQDRAKDATGGKGDDKERAQRQQETKERAKRAGKKARDEFKDRRGGK